MSLRKIKLSSLILGPILLVGCGGTSSTHGWTVSTDTLSSGALHVLNTPPPSGFQPTWTLKEDLRIGTFDQAGATSFGELKGLAVLDDGRIAVLDAQAQELRIFGPEGEHLATYGGKGEGPGELHTAFGLMRSPDGQLWVPDRGNARISVFDPDGGYQASFPLQLRTWRQVWSGAMSNDHQILKPSQVRGPPRRTVLRVYDSQMVLLDSLPLPEPISYDVREMPGVFYWESSDGSTRRIHPVPFFPIGVEVLDPRGGFWSKEDGDPAYRVRHFMPGGDTTLVLETMRSPVRIPSEERDSVIDGLRDELQQTGGARQDWARVPEVRPPVVSMFLSDEGKLWVQVASPDESLVYDVYQRTGQYEGTVETGLKIYSQLRPLVRGNQFWAVVTDEFDVPYVVRAHLVYWEPS